MTVKTDLEAVLKSLTLEEKISLLAGRDFWETVPIPAKGVPAIKTSDGPNGARGADFTGGTPAACFPAACCVAATFDTEAAYRVGQALAEETHSKGARCLLAPTTCIHRHPLGGRNFESFSEDPYLAGKLASQVIQGVQSRGVAATVKHFAANEQETDRFTVDETVGERALREIYMRPFEIAVREARPWAVMTAYNLVNGEHCDSNRFLLQRVLRGDWGWDGLVMSDWGGTNSVADAINAGLDLEMPGPARLREIPAVVQAVKEGKTSEGAIDERVRRVLWLLEKLKAFDDPTIPPEQAINKPEHQKLIRETGAHGSVLLKNDKQILPLTREKVRGKKVALIGLAKTPLAHGGGSASVNAHYKIAPWDAMQEAIGDSAELVYARGCHTRRLLPPVTNDEAVGKVDGLDGNPGFTMHWFDVDTNEVVATKHGQESCAQSPILNDEGRGKGVEYVGDFTPVASGSHYMGCSGLGPTQFFIDDKLIYDQKEPLSDAMGFLFGALAEEEFTFPFEKATTYRLRVRTLPPLNVPGLEILNGRSGLRLGLQLASDHDADLLGEATAVARECDYAVVFTGHDPQWETEGRDQASFHLPKDGTQDALVGAVAAACPARTVVVNSTGVPVALPWLDRVAALVQAWFPGQECGRSVADVLTGAVCPEGRLPVSWPRRLEDAPAHGNFPGQYVDGRLRVEYKEGVFVGYRHYDRAGGRDKLHFPFGFGLSYTTFALGPMRVSRGGDGDDSYAVEVEVANTGERAGGTLVQVYGGRAEAVPEHPVKSLVAFRKLRLRPGERQTVRLTASTRDLGHYDEGAGRWVVEAGTYHFMLGESAADVVQTVPVKIERDLQWKP
ncbi:family 3 glycoside hydrolase [Xylariaceae sp. FL0804]|nr:family 3 glycoside hydrolase [Xylariaceae sp. FL0804]